MKAPFITLLKAWLLLLTIWTIVLTILAIFASNSRRYDPSALLTRWSGDRLNFVVDHGVYVVTHLKDPSRHAFAELPKPLFVASSGGVDIPAAELAKLT